MFTFVFAYICFAKDDVLVDICFAKNYVLVHICFAKNDVLVYICFPHQDDPEWFWVVRADGQEGFVPAGYLGFVENMYFLYVFVYITAGFVDM